jgi:hypothetical protein
MAAPAVQVGTGADHLGRIGDRGDTMRATGHLRNILVGAVGTVGVLAMASPASAASTVTYNNPYVVKTTPLSLVTRAFANIDRAGSTSVQLIDVNSPDRQERYTDSTVTVRPGTYQVEGTFDHEPRPGRLYKMQTCFTPNGGSPTCGPWFFAPAAPVHSAVTTWDAQSVRDTSVMLAGEVDGARMDGTLMIQYGTTISYGTQLASVRLAASRGPDSNIVASGAYNLTPSTTYHFRACYKTQWPNNLTVFDCGSDHTFRTQPPATGN